jgi:hypothetical protein
VIDDDAKKAILARRARFVAAAMMGAGLVSCDPKSPGPFVCLSVSPPPPEAPPQVCLSVTFVEPFPPGGTDTTADGGVDDAGATDAGATDAGVSPPPQVCLSPVPAACLSHVPTKPSICLTK